MVDNLLKHIRKNLGVTVGIVYLLRRLGIIFIYGVFCSHQSLFAHYNGSYTDWILEIINDSDTIAGVAGWVDLQDPKVH